ncbi:hypothetical protein L107_08518 [Cyanobium sp. Copco_Reservoir_LC18]|nr:hypothetical protein L107_08518 [Cyanobium sp. Copco_Reservoir_LC18]
MFGDVAREGKVLPAEDSALLLSIVRRHLRTLRIGLDRAEQSSTASGA